MLKWILGISVLVVIAVAAVIFGPGFFWNLHGGKIVMDDNTRRFCRTFFRDSALIDDVMTVAEYDTTCLCFATDALKKAGNAPGDINDPVLLQEVEGIAPASIKKCIDQSGLN